MALLPKNIDHPSYALYQLSIREQISHIYVHDCIRGVQAKPSASGITISWDTGTEIDMDI